MREIDKRDCQHGLADTSNSTVQEPISMEPDAWQATLQASHANLSTELDLATADYDKLRLSYENLQAECQRLDAGWHEANVRGLELQAKLEHAEDKICRLQKQTDDAIGELSEKAEKLEQAEKDKGELVELVNGICEGINDPLVSMKSGGRTIKADFLLLVTTAIAKYEEKR